MSNDGASSTYDVCLHHVTGLIYALQMCSHLARNSEVYFEPLRAVFTPDRLGSMLLQLNSSIRAKTCNLIGNLCRHSSSWYSVLLQPVHLSPPARKSSGDLSSREESRESDFGTLLSVLIHCCSDADDSTRKFACFAGACSKYLP